MRLRPTRFPGSHVCAKDYRKPVTADARFVKESSSFSAVPCSWQQSDSDESALRLTRQTTLNNPRGAVLAALFCSPWTVQQAAVSARRSEAVGDFAPMLMAVDVLKRFGQSR